jgi:NAD(P)-dependent dehydrogenase (short-subunit alcohol dehydrogenase family)
MVILITGANGNIANYIISDLISLGHKILGCDIHETALNDSLFKYYKCDLSDEKSIYNMFNKINDSNINADVLINNAAIDFVPQEGKQSSGVEIENFSEIFDVNVKAPLILSSLLIDLWKARDVKGRIINLSSIYSLKSPDPSIYSNGFIKNVLYGASKAALNNISKQLSVIYGKDQILINTIIFGGLKSENQSLQFQTNYSTKTSIKRMMDKKDIMSPILFLLDKNNNYTNGAEIIVDGGFLNF